MQYYKIVDSNPSSSKYQEAQGVIRGQGHKYERWDGKKWVKDDEVLWRISGMGGDGHDFHKIPLAEAESLMKSLFV